MRGRRGEDFTGDGLVHRLIHRASTPSSPSVIRAQHIPHDARAPAIARPMVDDFGESSTHVWFEPATDPPE